MRNKNPSNPFLFLIGFLFCLSFYFRFQIGLAIAGFGIWFILFEKKYTWLLPIAAGFLIGFLLNTYLDYRFYHELVFTPARYFEINILQGKAAEFGTSSFLRYIGLLIAVITAPPFSIILFYYCIKAFFTKYDNAVFVAVLLFIIGHCFIGHKEERFLFPIFNALPLIVGWSLPSLLHFYKNCKKWIALLLKAALIITVILNTVMLVLFSVIPYGQTIYFGEILKNNFKDNPATIFCLYRTPFETMSGSPLIFYRKSVKNLELKKVYQNDSLRYLTGKGTYIATTFNEIKPGMALLDSMGYKPVLYSSALLWKVNLFLQHNNKPTINDAWVLYKKE